MRKPTTNPAARKTAAQAAKVPQFERYDRYPKEVDRLLLSGGAIRHYAEKVADIAAGVADILDLAMDDAQRASRRDGCDDDDTDSLANYRPLLNQSQLWNLQRLAVACLMDLQDETFDVMEWARKNGRPPA